MGPLISEGALLHEVMLKHLKKSKEKSTLSQILPYILLYSDHPIALGFKKHYWLSLEIISLI